MSFVSETPQFLLTKPPRSSASITPILRFPRMSRQAYLVPLELFHISSTSHPPLYLTTESFLQSSIQAVRPSVRPHTIPSIPLSTTIHQLYATTSLLLFLSLALGSETSLYLFLLQVWFSSQVLCTSPRQAQRNPTSSLFLMPSGGRSSP